MTDAAGNHGRIEIRQMESDDSRLGLELCRIAGWNQLESDWRRLLALEPDGVFVAEMDGRACATGTTTAYGAQTAWIGMILVHPDFRRCGIGSAIMNECIEYLQSRNVESIKLDATDDGRPVYLKLGFKDERPIWRYAGPRPTSTQAPAGVRPIRADDWPALAAIDRVAFGAERIDLLKALAEEGPSVAVERAEQILAYGFARRGFNAGFVGPIVATDPAAAREAVEALLAGLPEGEIFWDIMPDNHAACEIAHALDFSVARRLTRMYLGDRMNPGEVDLIFGAAGFELG